jgi:hypothetical protein
MVYAVAFVAITSRTLLAAQGAAPAATPVLYTVIGVPLKLVRVGSGDEFSTLLTVRGAEPVATPVLDAAPRDTWVQSLRRRECGERIAILLFAHFAFSPRFHGLLVGYFFIQNPYEISLECRSIV